MMTVSSAVPLFVSSAQSRGVSTSTATNYQAWLKRFIEEYDLPVDQVDRLIIEHYFSSLHREEKQGNLSKQTIFYYKHSVRQLFKWLYQINAIESDPTKGISIIRPRRQKRIRAMQRDTFKAIRAHTLNPRDEAILAIASNGLRPGEIINLKVQHVNIVGRSIYVNGKTGERLVHLTPQSIQPLAKWMNNQIFSSSKSSEYVFISLKGPRTGKKLTLDSLRLIYRRLARRAGVEDPNWSPKCVRHMIGRMVTEASDLETARDRLGHASITTTAIYAAATDEYIAKIADAVAEDLFSDLD